MRTVLGSWSCLQRVSPLPRRLANAIDTLAEQRPAAATLAPQSSSPRSRRRSRRRLRSCPAPCADPTASPSRARASFISRWRARPRAGCDDEDGSRRAASRRPQDGRPGVRARFRQGPRRTRLREGPARIAAGGDARPRADDPGPRARLRGRALARALVVASPSSRWRCPAGTRARSRSRRRRTRGRLPYRGRRPGLYLAASPPRAASAPRTRATSARAPPST